MQSITSNDFLKYHLAERSLGKILDVGSGDCAFLDTLLSLSDAEEIWSIDIDEDAISEGKRFAAEIGLSIHFRHYSILSPPISEQSSGEMSTALKSNYYNTIAMQDLLHHLSPGNFSHRPNNDLKKAIHSCFESCSRLLEPGAILIISETIADPNEDPDEVNLSKLHTIKAEVDSLHGIPHSYTIYARSLRRILKNSLESLKFTLENQSILPEENMRNHAMHDARELEKIIEFYARYIGTLKNVPGSESTMNTLLNRLNSLKTPLVNHGIAAPRRFMLIARKH